jgi:glycosyltransferase involved in cell wall biosynthesis
MEKVKILTIGTDKSLLDYGSISQTRQVEYFKNFKSADLLLLGSAKKVRETHGNVTFYSFGGSKRIMSFVKTFFGFLPSIFGNKYDLIYVQDVMYCGILGYIFSLFTPRTKFITQLHGDYIDNPLWINQRLENRFLNVAGKFLIRRSDKIRCVSIRIVNYLHNKLKIKKSKLASLPIGINGDEFNSDGVDVEKREDIFIFCGRLIDEKEPLFFCDIVIPLMKKYPNFKVEFIGEGNLKDKIVERFKEVGMEDRVIMLGFLGARAVARYYKKGFVLIHTAFWEGWGLPMVEASACGLPVVTTDTGCAGEVVIDNVNGIVLDSKIAEDYIVKIDELINDRSKFKEMCEAGNKLSTEWTFESMRTKTEKFLIDSLN